MKIHRPTAAVRNPSAAGAKPGAIVLEGASADRHLAEMEFDRFALRVAAVLARNGYADVRVARNAFKGRNQGGGADLTAVNAESGRRVVVQLKQRPPKGIVFRRAVDELRGVCLRDGADEALLVTTGRLSSSVRLPLASEPAPVRVVDGTELVKLESGDPCRPRKRAPLRPARRADCSPGASDVLPPCLARVAKRPERFVRVTVEIGPLRSDARRYGFDA